MSTTTSNTTNTSASTSGGKGKILIVLSSCHSIALKNKSDDRHAKDQETGFFLKELAQPLSMLLDEGYEVVFASPGGAEPAMDPMSDSALWFLGNWYEKNRNLDVVKSLSSKINNPIPLSTLAYNTNELSTFKGIFIPGGHAPMGDLGSDRDLGTILHYFHSSSKPTATICHGPIALVSTALVPEKGGFAYKDYKVTCYANKEEMSNELLWGARLEKKVEDALREQGMDVEVSMVPLMPKVVRDRELVSGEGPSSVVGLGKEFLKVLAEAA